MQNGLDQGSVFFSKQANNLNTAQKRNRRGVASPSAEVLFFTKNEHILNQSAAIQKNNPKQLESSKQDKDQFNFTFFKEKGTGSIENSAVKPQLNSNSHINVSNLINSAQGHKRNDSNLLRGIGSGDFDQGNSLNSNENNLSHFFSQTSAPPPIISQVDYQNYVNGQLI